MTDALSPRCIWNARALLGEGPIYDARDGALYFVDIKASTLMRFSLADEKRQTWEMPEQLCWIAPRANGPGFVAGFARRLALLTLEPLTIIPIGVPESDRPGNRLNDAKVDHLGRLWAGSMDDREERQSGALYRLDPDLTWARVDDGYGVANGPAFSPDGEVLYHADSAARTVWRFGVSVAGTLLNREVFVRFPETWGYPDGMTTDAEGGVWIAHWDGARVSRFTPRGALDASISMPVSRPTSCAFAGEQLERLFVTSAAIGREDEPLAGSLFELDVGVRGASVHAFAG